MKRKVLFLVGLLGLVIFTAGIIRYLTNRGPKQGELRVDSEPQATVFLDDKNIGKTPYRDKVNTGDYTIKLVPDSTTTQLTTWQGKVSVGQNLLTYVNANISDSDLTTAVDVIWLEKITSRGSEFSVTTSPDGATLVVDDAVKGVTPLSLQDITPGDHRVSINNNGFLSRSLKIKTTAGYRLIANLKLALSPGGPAPTASPTASITPAPTGKKSATTSASQVPDPAKPFVVIKDTPTGFLRVRMDPSTGATEAARVNPGEKYTIVDSQNGWYQIKYDGTNSGWVSGQYAQKVE